MEQLILPQNCSIICIYIHIIFIHLFFKRNIYEYSKNSQMRKRKHFIWMEQRRIEVLVIKKIQKLGKYSVSRRQGDMWKSI